MPKPKKGPRLGGSPAHQRLIVSNLATQLFEHGRITTTEAKARVLRPVAEKLITKAKRGDLHNRREVLKTVRDKTVVHVLFTEIAPTFAERPGGYTRITKIGHRKGDNAPDGGHRAGDRGLRAEGRRAGEEDDDQEDRGQAAPAKTEEEPADEAPVEETEVVADPVEASAEAVDLEPATEVEGVDEDVFEETEGGVSGKYAGSHVLLEDESQAPEGFPIKGNEDSMKFHEPDGQWYEQTVAEVWFDSVESAEAAGFTRAGE